MALRPVSAAPSAFPGDEEKPDDRDAAAREPIRVLVADGSPFTRAGARPLLEPHGCLVCAVVPDAPSAVQKALRERPDVCLLDTELDGAIDAARTIADTLPGTSIVMFAPSLSEADLFSALLAGASGYLSKDTEPGQLTAALRRVCEGEAVLPRTLLAKFIAELQERERRRYLPFLLDLTGRELEVLDLLAEGRKTAEIAERLFVARVTVRTHIASILRKLGVSDREAAIRLVNNR